jgi:hypothetical protein
MEKEECVGASRGQQAEEDKYRVARWPDLAQCRRQAPTTTRNFDSRSPSVVAPAARRRFNALLESV